jgi:hypothetical protein
VIDRPGNTKAAAKLGIRTILIKDAEQLRRDLRGLAVEGQSPVPDAAGSADSS